MAASSNRNPSFQVRAMFATVAAAQRDGKEKTTISAAWVQ
jgi:hypothetical protein